MKNLFLVSVVTEILGIMVVALGVGIEIAYRAHIGYILITGGAVITAAGGLLFAKVVRRK